MKTITQHFKMNLPDETVDEFDAIHIVSETGHFEKDGKDQGWNIQLGSGASVEDYTEVDDGLNREIPVFEDVEETIEDEEPTDEELVEAAKILLGGGTDE